MGVSTNTTKRRLVEETNKIIVNEGLEKVTVRRVTDAAGCSPANLYRHFETLDYLILLASIKILSTYFSQLSDLPSAERAYDRNLLAWHLFNEKAFRNPPVYLHIFWGPQKDEIDMALMDYFDIYPMEHANGDLAYFTISVYSGNIKERDFIWLRKAANEGDIKYKDAMLLAEIDSDIVGSRLREHLSDYKEPGVADKASTECNAILDRLYENFRIKK